MKFFKSDFSRVHFAVMLFALANVIIGLLIPAGTGIERQSKVTVAEKISQKPVVTPG